MLILEIREKGRSIVVSRRALLDAERANAAAEIINKLETGAVMEGTVSSVKKYGALRGPRRRRRTHPHLRARPRPRRQRRRRGVGG